MHFNFSRYVLLKHLPKVACWLKIQTIVIAGLICVGCATLKCNNCLHAAIPVNHFPPLHASIKTNPASSHWHIYLEGDGNPWRKGITPAANPNSHQQLALQLMNLDTNASIYLERPCYGYSGAPPPPCSPKRWTDERYSQATLNAMDETLTQLMAIYGAKPIIFIGHSGGATLALLLAHQRHDIDGIITLAGNLDPDGWTRFHHYLPLEGSLNPINLPPLSPRILRWHLIGENDNVIPPQLFEASKKHDPAAQFTSYPYDHHCCWKKNWPQLLQQFNIQVQQFNIKAQQLNNKEPNL